MDDLKDDWRSDIIKAFQEDIEKEPIDFKVFFAQEPS